MIKVILTSLVSISLTLGTVAGRDDYQGSRRASSSCDSACQLRSQDMAFALLLETYREFKGCRIEQQYQSRLAGAETLAHPNLNTALVIKSDSAAMKKLQEFVRLLARTERDLEMEGLQTQVVNFENTYKCIRRADEAQLGITVSNAVNTRAAAKQLKEFVIVYQGALSAGNSQPLISMPADSMLLDVEPSIPTTSQIITPCE